MPPVPIAAADRAVRDQVQAVEVGAHGDERDPGGQVAQVRDDVPGLGKRVALAAEYHRDRAPEVGEDRRGLRVVGPVEQGNVQRRGEDRVRAAELAELPGRRPQDVGAARGYVPGR